MLISSVTVVQPETLIFFVVIIVTNVIVIGFYHVKENRVYSVRIFTTQKRSVRDPIVNHLNRDPTLSSTKVVLTDTTIANPCGSIYHFSLMRTGIIYSLTV